MSVHHSLISFFPLQIRFVFVSLTLLCILSASARAQTITFDTSRSGAMFYNLTQQTNQTLSWVHPVGAGTNRILIVGVSTYSTLPALTSRVASVTYGTVTMTRIGTLTSPATIASDIQSAVEMFYLGEAGIASASGPTITATFNTLTPLQYAVGGSASFFGVNQSQPFATQSTGDSFAQSTGTSSTPSVTLLGATNQIALDTLASSPGAGFFAPNPGQTRLWVETPDNPMPPFFSFDVGAGSMKPGASPSVAMSWNSTTSQPWAIRAISIQPASQATAASITISGRIVTSDGAPIEGATVRLGGAKIEKAITDADGRYSFDSLDAGGFYTVTPARANFSFAPASRSISTFAAQTDALFTATADTSPLINPLDTTDYFVRQQYVDFLNREPDQAGFAFWTNEIDSCGGDAACIDVKRQNVSAAFFLSTEFQQTGFFVYQLYKAAFGRMVRYQEFMPDMRAVGQGVIVGADGWSQRLEQNKESFVNAFAARSQFKDAFDSLTNAQFVDALNANTGNALTRAERDALVNALNAGRQTRAGVLRSIAGNQAFAQQEFNRALVLMQYFGYLRRNPDDAPDGKMDGFNFWLAKLNSFNGDYMRAQLIEAFISSQEYRHRFAR